MAQYLIYTSFIIFTVLIYNKLYFFFYKKKIVFYNFFIKFIYFTLFFFFLVYIFFDYENLDNNFLQSFIGLYIISFISIFFTASLKSYESPTALIYKLIKKKTDFNRLHKYLKKKKIISSRILDLKNQKLIAKSGNKIYLTALGSNFCRIYFFFMKFFKLKSLG